MAGSELRETIGARLDQIRQTIPDQVRLIAVSKQASVNAMRIAYEAGIRDFGESRIKEATAKQAELQDLPDITWHFIGHLQGNKANKAIALFQWIHSVDNLKLAQRLDRLAAEFNHSPNVCLQVKIVTDETKSGWAVPELLNDLLALDQCHHLQMMGLMTIPPYGLDPAETLSIFTRTHELADKIRQQQWSNLPIHHLSMGMSDDYPLAIQAGATMIRLGRILFGDRN